MLCPNCQKAIEDHLVDCPHCKMGFCPSCKSSVGSDAAVCGVCGLEFAAHCSRCGHEVKPQANLCSYCGAILDETERDWRNVSDGERDYDRSCPTCATPLDQNDSFCPVCGQTFCGRCAEPVDEEARTCSHCGTLLFFECPLCQFELTVGTELCPNCGALFPLFCTKCRAPLPPDANQCPECQTAVRISERTNARVIHTLINDSMLVHIVACPACGSQFDPAEGPCSVCNYPVCPNCHVNLEDGEVACPRCGQGIPAFGATAATLGACPQCERTIPLGCDECPRCGQTVCPECLAAIAEDDVVCARCGAEFEFACPRCQAHVDSEASSCPACDLSF